MIKAKDGFMNDGKSQDLLRLLMSLLQVSMTAIAGYAATEIKTMSKSISDLNVQVAVVLHDVSNQREDVAELKASMNDIKLRVGNLEYKGLESKVNGH